jgi:hypothetical protein
MKQNTAVQRAIVTHPSFKFQQQHGLKPIVSVDDGAAFNQEGIEMIR